MRLRLLLQKTMKKVSDCVWRTTSSILTITHNFFCQFWNVTFNKIVCQLAVILILWNTSLVHSFWYFWLAVLAFKCQLASSARRAARSALPSAAATVVIFSTYFQINFSLCFVKTLIRTDVRTFHI